MLYFFSIIGILFTKPRLFVFKSLNYGLLLSNDLS